MFVHCHATPQVCRCSPIDDGILREPSPAPPGPPDSGGQPGPSSAGAGGNKVVGGAAAARDGTKDRDVLLHYLFEGRTTHDRTVADPVCAAGLR